MEIAIKIQGKTPLICNRFTDEAALAATSGTRGALQGGQAEPLEIAEGKLYVDDAGVVGIPQPNLLRCIMEGGRFHKIGKKQVTTLKESLVPACVEIHDVFIPLETVSGWKVDTRPVRIPSTGGRILTHRPMFDDWALSFTVMLDHGLMSDRLFREIVDDAGNRVGLGDFRPGTRGPYGRFSVTRWEIQ